MPLLPPSLDPHLLLTGFFSLPDYLHWRARFAPAPEPALRDAWRLRAAAAAGLDPNSSSPDLIRIDPLAGDLEPLASQLLRNPFLKRSLELFPARASTVELDRLIILQLHVNLHWATHLRQRWDCCRTAAERLAFCLGPSPLPPVTSARLGPDSWVFTSASQDLRVQESILLSPAQVQDYTPPGPPVAFAGASVGFGANCLHAVQWQSRLILVNGTHRAWALRDAGETSAPCLIQTATSADHLALIAPAVLDSASQILDAPRPALLGDLFAPTLTERLELPRRLRQVRVTLTVEELDLPLP